MAKKSWRCCHESSYGGGFISIQQFLAELSCERNAKRSGRALPYRFWELDDWKEEFKKQVRLATARVKKYGGAVVLEAFRKTKWIYSFGSRYLDKPLEEELAKQSAKPESCAIDTSAEPKDVYISVRPAPMQEKSTLSKLRDL